MVKSMFLNQWSIALSLISLVVITLTFIACKTAIQVLRYWDPTSDNNRQIRLENETWLVSTLVEYGLSFQVVSLILFVMAADNFSSVIVGAMCATGALTANNFGMPLLLIKITGVFLYGFWIVLHKFDIQSENYPLLKTKYIYLLILLPFLIADIVLQIQYIANIKPDIITSCCAVVFGESTADSNLFGAVNKASLLKIFYGLCVLLYVLGWLCLKKRLKFLIIFNGIVWSFFLIISFLCITTIFSSYVYAMPYHRCPFCILKPDYNYIGYVMYGSLVSATFFSFSSVIGVFIARIKELRHSSIKFQVFAHKSSLWLLTLFIISVSYHIVIYHFFGGER